MGYHDFRSISIARTVLDGSLRVIIHWRQVRVRCEAEIAYFSVNVTKCYEISGNVTKYYEMLRNVTKSGFRNIS